MIKTIEVNGTEYVEKVEYDYLISLLDACTEPMENKCSYDHDQNCQAHFLHTAPCPYAVARAFIRLAKAKSNE